MTDKKTPGAIKYKGGIIRPTAQGTHRAEYNHNGERTRETHKTLQAAKDWIDDIKRQRAAGLAPSSPQEAQDAAQARAILATAGGAAATLTQAAQHYIDTRANITHKPLGEAITEYWEIREGDGLRDKSMDALRYKLRPLLKKYPAVPITQITPDQLRQTLTGAPGTRNSTRRYYILFWGWAIKQGYAKGNTAAALTIARADDPQPTALTLEQTQSLLKAAIDRDPELLPRIYIGLFTGLRSAELDRLAATDIRGGKIHLGAHITKTRDRRILDLMPNMQAWLDAYPPGPTLLLTNHRKRDDEIRRIANLHPWPENAMRHSFATYHLALHQDAGKTATYTRHRNTDTLHRHYTDLATREDGEIYFSLTPETVSKFRPKAKNTQ